VKRSGRTHYDSPEQSLTKSFKHNDVCLRCADHSAQLRATNLQPTKRKGQVIAKEHPAQHGRRIARRSNRRWTGYGKILVNAANDPEAKSIICVLDALDEFREVDRRRVGRSTVSALPRSQSRIPLHMGGRSS
jgi:hypothetical protein